MANIHGADDAAWIGAIKRLSFWLNNLLKDLDKLLGVIKKKKLNKKEFNKYKHWVSYNIQTVQTPVPPNVAIMTVIEAAGVNSLVKLWKDFVASITKENYDNARTHLVNLIEVCSNSI
jgi:hypothetical protein